MSRACVRVRVIKYFNKTLMSKKRKFVNLITYKLLQRCCYTCKRQFSKDIRKEIYTFVSFGYMSLLRVGKPSNHSLDNTHYSQPF